MANDDTKWMLSVPAKTAVHASGLVVRIVGKDGNQFSVQPLRETLPPRPQSDDKTTLAAWEQNISSLVQEGGQLLVSAVARLNG